MTLALSLLEDVRWRGEVVVGDRPRALLAALAADGGRPVRPEQLIELVWGDEAPTNAAKGLQVLVSRTRSACGEGAIVRDRGGYRLGIAPAEVDSVRLARLVSEARAALEHDPRAAAELSAEALALVDGMPATDDDEGPLSKLRRAAAADLTDARLIHARARGRTGAHAEALPTLEAAAVQRPEDESILADLLRAEAMVRGPAAALQRFERHRRDLRERLGTNPGENLQRIQRELLALDSPVRSGVRYDPTALLGRDGDIERLRGLMRGARVVSIVGPGGLGKTRLAHVLARDPSLPVAHVVELVGVTSPDDVVAEVGTALDIRDSVSSRRAVTRAQRADVRARIAQRLAQAPSLLVLDNCEHVIDAVAELVAHLIAATPEARILTTSRAPLAIAAEHVYLLGELDADDGAALFRVRAEAARPHVQLDDAAVHSIVTRLDGLPLAIELAAAKVRAMSVQEIDRRLENRFTLLRGGDRSAPDRHRTLLAVIDWSWNLLDDAQRRALRWLALFHDGFTLDAAQAVLGADAFEAVQGLVGQSLLSVSEAPDGVRYRMLETVREFGRMQLAGAGEQDDARAALRRWAVEFAGRHGNRLASSEQLAAIDAIDPEQTNLADELRGAIADGDRNGLVALLATLGLLWSIRGEHSRLTVLADAVSQALRDWRPPPELEDATRAAATVVLSNALIPASSFPQPLHALLCRLGPSRTGDPRLAGMVQVLLAYDPTDPAGFTARLEALAGDDDRYTARAASQWLSHVRENAGDIAGSIEAAEAALARMDDGDGPWHPAILHYQLAQLLVQQGEDDLAVSHARVALEVMQRIGARDDELQLRALLALCAVADGRLDDAEHELDTVDRIDHDGTVFAGGAFRQVGRAELALARGEHGEALRLYRECAANMRELKFPGIDFTGVEPWALFGDAAALIAHAHFATDAEERFGQELFAGCRERMLRVLGGADAFFDAPVLGLQLFALGSWGLRRDAMALDDSLVLLALAKRFAYVRVSSTTSWEQIAAFADERAPGRLAALCERYRDRQPAELTGDARAAVERIATVGGQAPQRPPNKTA